MVVYTGVAANMVVVITRDQDKSGGFPSQNAKQMSANKTSENHNSTLYNKGYQQWLCLLSPLPMPPSLVVLL